MGTFKSARKSAKKSVFANKSAQKSTLKSTFGSSEPICAIRLRKCQSTNRKYDIEKYSCEIIHTIVCTIHNTQYTTYRF